jgi:hypothetical protein
MIPEISEETVRGAREFGTRAAARGGDTMRTIAIAALLLAAQGLAAAGADVVGLGKSCDGFAGIKCGAGLRCEHAAGYCGGADIGGTCMRIAEVCTRLYRPVCACTGKTYGNDCERQAANVQKMHDGPCP